MLALPIFPGSRPPSIFGACELNFCVRDGNRWTLTAINTNFVDGSSPSLCQSASRSNSFCILAHKPAFVKPLLSFPSPNEARFVWDDKEMEPGAVFAR